MVCPVCHYKESTPYLDLKKFPIYQHPVVNLTAIKAPYFIDLTYMVCNQCDHCYQPDYDESVLESIYRNFYYTPRESNIGSEIRSGFIQTTEALFKQLDNSASILEVGCSSGETLEVIENQYGLKKLYAVEPNKETGKKAIEKGVNVYEGFFNNQYANTLSGQTFDVIFHRHVIEHIFNFDDFFTTTEQAANQSTLLIIETPSLDEAVNIRTIAPFHVEHVHVFSIYSLSKLSEKYGWYLLEYNTNEYGNMILIFSKDFDKRIDPPRLIGAVTGNQDYVASMRDELIEKIGQKEVVLWGAGSGGRNIVSILDLNPEYIIDSNRNKVGRHFPGMKDTKIITPDDFKSTTVFKNKNDSACVLVASYYFKEIKQKLNDLGWNGDVVSAYI